MTTSRIPEGKLGMRSETTRDMRARVWRATWAILLGAVLSGCATTHVAGSHSVTGPTQQHAGPTPTICCIVQGKRQRDLANELNTRIDKCVLPGAVKLTIIEVDEHSGLIQRRSNADENKLLAQCCREVAGNQFFVNSTPHFAVFDKLGILRKENGSASEIVTQAAALSRQDISPPAPKSTPTGKQVAKVETAKEKAERKAADQMAHSNTQPSAASRRNAIYPKATTLQSIETQRINELSLGELHIGDDCFLKDDYAGAELHYLRAIALTEAWCRRFYGPEPGAGIKPTKTPDDVLQRFQSIRATTHQSSVDNLIRSGHKPDPNRDYSAGYSVLLTAATTVHLLGVIQDWRGAYGQGDRLFRAEIPINLDAGLVHYPFSKNRKDKNMTGIYKQLLSNVLSKFGPRHQYTATRLEELAAFYMPSSQGKDTVNGLSQDWVPRYKHIQGLLEQAIAIRQEVDAAYDPAVLKHDLSRLRATESRLHDAEERERRRSS